MSSAKRIIEKFSENIVNDPLFESISGEWNASGTPTAAGGVVTVKEGDRLYQRIAIQKSSEENNDQQAIYGFQFYAEMTIPAGEASRNTLGTVLISVEYSDGTSDSVSYIASRPQTTSTNTTKVLFHNFEVTESEEVYPVGVSLAIYGFVGAMFSGPSIRMNFGMVLADFNQPELPPNLIRNTSFEIMYGIGSNVPLGWSGEFALSDIAYPVGFKDFPDNKSAELTGNNYMESEAEAHVSDKGFILSWQTRGDGARFEVFDSKRKVIHSGNVGKFSDWLMQYAIIPYGAVKDAGSIGVRFVSNGGNAIIDCIKLEENTLPASAEFMAWPSEWCPHPEDSMEVKMKDLWIKSLKVGDKELIGKFDDQDTEPVGVLYEALNENTGLFLELFPEAGELFGTVELLTGETVTATYDIAAEELASLKLPSVANQGLRVTLTDVPTEVFDSRMHVSQVYNVSFTRERVGDPFKTLRLGSENLLLNDKYKLNDVNSMPTEEMTYTNTGEFALTAILNGTYDDYTITVGVLTDGVVSSTYEYGSNSNKFPVTTENDGIIIIASDVPYTALLEDPHAYNYQIYGVVFKRIGFEGLINVKYKDEKGLLISSQEIMHEEPGTYEVTAEEFDAYVLTSAGSALVELTYENPKRVVEFKYRKKTPGESNGYVMEFATAPMDLVTRFNFSNPDGYASIESVTLGIQHSGTTFTNLAWEPRMGSNGRYIGINVRASTAAAGASISIQAVCFIGGA